MNDDQWPPPAPGVNKAFKKAHNTTNDNPPPETPPMVTKKELEELIKQRKRAAADLKFTPPGTTSGKVVDRKRERDIERMQNRLRQKKEKTRDDFERSR